MRPLLLRTNDDIDAHNGRAYHGPHDEDHERDAAGGTEFALERSDTERGGNGAESSLRAFDSRPGTAGRTPVLRTGTEAGLQGGEHVMEARLMPHAQDVAVVILVDGQT